MDTSNDPQVTTPAGEETQGQATGESLLSNQQSRQNTQEPTQTEPKAVPETYDLRIPEGMTGIESDEATVAEFSALASRMQLSQDEAQELYEFGAKKMGDGMEAVKLQIMARKDEWRKKSEQTPEIIQNLDAAKNLVKRFGTPELDEFFEESGAGCHPEFLKFLCAVGDVFKQDTLVMPRQGGQGERSYSMLDKASALYPNMK